MTPDLRGVRPDHQLSPTRLRPAAASTDIGILNLRSSIWVPGVCKEKSTINISLQNTSPQCPTVSLPGLLQE